MILHTEPRHVLILGLRRRGVPYIYLHIGMRDRRRAQSMGVREHVRSCTGKAASTDVRTIAITVAYRYVRCSMQQWYSRCRCDAVDLHLQLPQIRVPSL